MKSPQSHLARNYKRADSDVQKFQRQIKRIKYPVLAIEPAQSLESKIIQFKNQKLQKQMKQKLINQKNLNAYRKIRGDGNCLFRALAYSYLSNVKNLVNTEDTFYQLSDIELTICTLQSIPKQFKPFYNDKLLKEALLNNWSVDVKHFTLLCNSNNKRILSRLFKKNPYLDFIVILYFRSLCLQGLSKYKQQVKEFMKGTQEQQIKSYGEESEGVILDICSRFMKVGIDVYEVRKQQLKHYSYKNQKSLKDSINVSLLYYENHYDIIQQINSSNLQQQKRDTKIQQEEYYSKINQNMVQGQCIECNKQDYIYEENYLCDHCFEMSKNQLLNTVKGDKWVRGLCRDCGRKGLKVLQLISLCQQCIQRQSKVTQQDLKKTSPKKPKYYCRKCQSQVNENDECPVCSLQEYNYCLQCDRKTYIDRQTKLCKKCKQMQQYVLNREEKRKEDMKNKCPDCQYSLTSASHEYKCLKKLKQKCRYCGEFKDSQIHEMKCVKKLAAGKIGNNQKQFIPVEKKQNFQTRKCRTCNQLRIDEVLVNGQCKRCRQYFLQNNKVKDNKDDSYFGRINSRNEQSKLGSRLQSDGQHCRICNRTSYVYKFQNSICPPCKQRIERGGRV